MQHIRVCLAALLLAGPAAAAEPVAQVFVIDGTATAGERELRQGDAVEPGAVVQTGPGARVGLFAAEIYVQLDPDSAVRFDRDAQGRVRLALESGRARVVDTRGGGDPGAIAALGAEATIAGGDSEIYLLSEKTGRYAMFCEWEGPLAVSKDPHALVADPGNCILVKPGEAPYRAAGHDHQIPLLPSVDQGPDDLLSSRFATPQVAAGPFHGFPGPADAPDRERDPCDIPGTGCESLFVFEPPPDTDPDCLPGLPCDD
jgi:hypothetical protein